MFAGVPTGPGALGRSRIPTRIRACLFDLDGVLVRTGPIHAAAWKELFDGFLGEYGRREGRSCRAFELPGDYVKYVDGRLREDGVRRFLESRGIDLPEGAPTDPPSASSVHGLAARKDQIVTDVIEQQGIDVYEGSIRFVEHARAAGLRCAVVSASKNTRSALEATGIGDLFEVVVDGVVAEQRELPGKPRPDTFLAAADALDVEPRRAAVFEDALAGVQAGRAGSFGWIVAVDRGAGADALSQQGADVVVGDLSELLDAS
jgi:beta-phosphoglucomutase family hydrolase